MNLADSPPRAGLAARVLAGERRAIAQAITRIENAAPGADALVRMLEAHRGRAAVLGITGAPGAGKSTLINALLGELLRRELGIAVVAVDPSSPITGGAVLGDRVRMGEHGAHERVFIRSVSSRGHMGGLSRTTGAIVDVFDAAGFDVVIVETVGAGQSEVEITALADARIVVCPPGLGDDVQAIKAGILEIADIFVVNKGDLPAADATMRDLRDMLRLRRRGEQDVAVLKTTATRGEGVVQVVDAALAHVGKAGRGRRFARSQALTRDEILALDGVLDTRRAASELAADSVPRALVEAVLAAGTRAGAIAGATDAPRLHLDVLAGEARQRVVQVMGHTQCGQSSGDDSRTALRNAPVLIVIGANSDGPAAALECGRLGANVMAAARARGLHAMPLAVVAHAREIAAAIGKAREGLPAFAIALGYPRRGASSIEADASAPTVTYLGFD